MLIARRFQYSPNWLQPVFTNTTPNVRARIRPLAIYEINADTRPVPDFREQWPVQYQTSLSPSVRRPSTMARLLPARRYLSKQDAFPIVLLTSFTITCPCQNLGFESA